MYFLVSIQNINFKQNLIQQIIDVHEVSVETAGSSKTEIAIKALDLEQAKALKELVLKKSKTVIQSTEKVEDKPLLKISVLELFKVSLTENHLRNLFLFFAILIEVEVLLLGPRVFLSFLWRWTRVQVCFHFKTNF